MKVIPGNTKLPELHRILLTSVAPRPIALASTIDKTGNPNLSPFSFFNIFGVNPPTLIFSPSRRGKDNTTKHTFENLKEIDEVVINTVSYSMVEQISLSSSDFDKGVDEFIKAGFTKIESELVKPFRVKEALVQFECKVKEIIETSQLPGAGNLVICEILMIHINDQALNDKGFPDQNKLDLVGRMGGNLYNRTIDSSQFEVVKPLEYPGIGIDVLPNYIKGSDLLTGNELGKLGSVREIPDQDRIDILTENLNVVINDKNAFKIARELLNEGKSLDALCVLLKIKK